MVHILNVAEKPSVAKALSQVFSNLAKEPINSEAGKSVYNRIFTINNLKFPDPRRPAQPVPHKMVLTSVAGHISNLDFSPPNNSWSACQPSHLFQANIERTVSTQFEDLKKELEIQARKATVLVLWLDCDREGEAIADEVATICKESNRSLQIFRAHFSSVLPGEITNALNRLGRLDYKQVHAVNARQEIDLRIGAAFTRLQTKRLQSKFGLGGVVSYGPCQFPTLGFVVERWARIETFIPERFYTIKMAMKVDPDDPRSKEVNFLWKRYRLFDRLGCAAIYLRTLQEKKAVVVSTEGRIQRKYRPIPLATVELQKRASKYLRISSEQTMEAAEKLYMEGYISYPRTETEKFPQEYDIKGTLASFRNGTYSDYVSKLLDQDKYQYPRSGVNDDKAHPPITPVKAVDPNQIQDPNQRKIYELVVKHFLACCSKDGIGQQTVLTVKMGTEVFTAKGLMIMELNWLEIYKPWEYWGQGAGTLPNLENGKEFEPSSLIMENGSTCAPNYISEVELISEMDKHGIGTDATIASHIKTIQEREYVTKDNAQRFIPTRLGIALVEGYNSMGYQLNKPHLRAKMERSCNQIAEGSKNKEAVIKDVLDEMKRCFISVEHEVHKLDAAMSRHFTLSAANGVVKEANFSRCKCGSMMDLKEIKQQRVNNNNNNNINNNNRAPQQLYCRNCSHSLTLPFKGSFTAITNSFCDECTTQALLVTKDDKSTYVTCPHCKENPPAEPELFKCPKCKRSGREGTIKLGRIPMRSYVLSCDQVNK
ncbi:hypothetical protein TL16_g11935 [Triparma laevis f. inornata]|uniref:DNA topoisomerase n=1 Tax=Triparma laevis f. inornata TaxID=1714386 RepID=A0A9W7BRH1_9STRA|nr:hypothetical protein TL16_g11935 [Triparma laevis f. inornata]